eukprot:c3228_g1_i1.p1 GENE.c3228_g1_i1~~c3228_g1_i1.p1  ORF type:complete len:312 (+),score=57.11 c3228_g1_i1:59-937(+)
MLWTLFIASRPWSFPCSLMPCLLTLCVALKSVEVMTATLWVNFAISTTMVFSFHLAGNLANTYFDFKHGVDTKKHSDDRSLVDGLCSPSTIFSATLISVVCGGSLGALIVIRTGANLLPPIIMGGVLALLYSATPFNLKRIGMGDVAMFLAFGPILTGGMGCVLGLDRSALYQSIVLGVGQGIMTTAILHGNNTRDLATDKQSGVHTLAGALGFHGSVILYRIYLAIGLVSSWIALPSPLAYVLLAFVPWAYGLTVRFAQHDLSQMPQRTAQFLLVFSVVSSLVLLLNDRLF